ncbi:lipocalin family protein [Pseudopedobacter beijingensis]|uniref:Lipocalin family protein n=1 Tax=Pseudopedobacter beijingensis TaxID=1207056 RepID=A0ABW4ICD5_9SPHI
MKNADKYFKIGTLALLIIASVSCKKDKGTDLSNDLLVGTWKMTERIEDEASTMDNCAKSNIFKFNADGTVQSQDWIDDGTGGCKDATPSSINIKWAKTGENKYKYIMSFGGQSEELAFTTQFSESNNKVIITESDEDGVAHITFIRQ